MAKKKLLSITKLEKKMTRKIDTTMGQIDRLHVKVIELAEDRHQMRLENQKIRMMAVLKDKLKVKKGDHPDFSLDQLSEILLENGFRHIPDDYVIVPEFALQLGDFFGRALEVVADL